MIKRTIYFSNAVYLSKKENQIRAEFALNKSDLNTEKEIKTIPIEDIGIVVFDHQQITITHGLLSALIENNTSVVTCDSAHMPNGLFLALDTNQTQSEMFRAQINASEPLKKQLWQQTISAKLVNQAAVLGKRKISNDNLKRWAKTVKSGDPDNLEGRAAAYYWKNIFPKELEFTRDRYGMPPNNLLNYGYAILRAVVARALVASGLLPTLGIHHRNKYNAYCLADDIMEPYRPYVDEIVATYVEDGEDFEELTQSIKQKLLSIPVIDITIDAKKSPLMVGVQRTTASLAKCFEGESRKMLYPVF